MSYDTLIIEGGGFKTAFTSGVVDAMIATGYRPFDTIIGVSGGAVALSYYMSEQYRYCINAMKYLAASKQFAQYRRTFSEKGYLDIDFIATVAAEKVPFDLKKALKNKKSINPFIVATNRKNGKPEYFNPTEDNWVQAVVASSTLPFATKGVHKISDKSYFDGGWSDPLPVKWAYENGAKKILVIRTKPKGLRIKQSWADYFGSKYFKSTPKLCQIFESSHEIYNDALDFMDHPPRGLKITQIAPKKLLKSGTYSYSKSTLMLDYRYGVDKGLRFVSEE